MKKKKDFLRYYNLANNESVYRARQKGLLRRDFPHVYRIIDLFAGAGGLTLGFTKRLGQVFAPVWANDFNIDAATTYNDNFGNHCTTDDIQEIVEKRIEIIPKADVVIGGPPCQGFSLLNKQRKNDSRKQLWRPYLKIVKHSGAQIFVMENVPQLIGSEEYKEILDVAYSLGFQTASAKLCAADYGVPQTRWRAFIIGCNFTDPHAFFPPKKTHRRPPNMETRLIFSDDFNQYISLAKPWLTVRDEIGDLPPPKGTEIRSEPPPLNLHFGRVPTPKSLKRYMAIPEEGMNRFDLQKRVPKLTPDCWIRKTKGGTDLFGRLWWDRPAFTIRTEFFKPEKGRYLHPCQHRPITHREAARLQSFPDDFIFSGTKIEIARQIGNAVPPRLAARIADCVFAMLASKEQAYDGHIFEEKKKSNNGKHQRKRYVA